MGVEYEWDHSERRGVRFTRHRATFDPACVSLVSQCVLQEAALNRVGMEQTCYVNPDDPADIEITGMKTQGTGTPQRSVYQPTLSDTNRHTVSDTGIVGADGQDPLRC